MIPTTIDLICFSHLRWGFVFQRPQHIMSRFARNRRVFYLEEPVFEEVRSADIRESICAASGVRVATPVLPLGLSPQQINVAQQELLNRLLGDNSVEQAIAWYYTPMAKEFSSPIRPLVTVYDCMDELSAFAGAPPAMRANERALFQDADLVFTGGASLYESKRKQHSAVYAFPSSVDIDHFRRARTRQPDPADQRSLRHPRLGYAGVIDERMDIELLRQAAAARPDWEFILLGPVVKIDPASLPQAANIHYLGMKPYSELPVYFSGWDVGMLPFALNASTRFISPTKTPEYLAAGLAVVSTPIRDVVTPYGDLGLVGIAAETSEFLSVVEKHLQSQTCMNRRKLVDEFLSRSSWDKTWSAMTELIEEIITRKVAAQLTSGVSKGIAYV